MGQVAAEGTSGGGIMTAPTVDLFACATHPFGSVEACGTCATVRRRQRAWLQRHDTPMKGAAYISPRGRDGRISDVVVGPVESRGTVVPEHGSAERALARVLLARFADDERNPGEDRYPRLNAALERDRERAGSARRVALAQGLIEELVPEAVVGSRVKVEHGSVVVQLDSHGRKRTARRVLTAFAVAALALWVVAS